MYTGTMYSVLCSTMSRLIRPFVSCCSCTSVQETEWDEGHYQTWAGRQAPTCQRIPSVELIPQTAGAASGSVAEAEPKSLVLPSTIPYGVVPSNEVNEQQCGNSKQDTAEGFLGPRFDCAPEAEPTTPLQISPVASRGLSHTTSDTQDIQIDSVTSNGVPGEPAAEPVPSLALSSIHADNDNSTAADPMPSLALSSIHGGNDNSTAAEPLPSLALSSIHADNSNSTAAEPVPSLALSSIHGGNDNSTAAEPLPSLALSSIHADNSNNTAAEPVPSLAPSSIHGGNDNSTAAEPVPSLALSSTDSGNSSCSAAEPVKSTTLSSFNSSDSDSSSTTTGSSSGGSTVSSSTLSCGAATATNKRAHQEDRASAKIFTSSDYALGFHRLGAAAVFDGHGGSEASEYLQQHFLSALMQKLQLGVSPQEATAAAVQQVEAHLMSIKCIAGSTLTAAVVLDDQLIVAQVGDSRAVLCGAGGKVKQLTADHKPTDAGERERIATADPAAEVSSDGYCYGMGVSRGLGSYRIKSDGTKKAFIAAVDITVHQLQPDDAFVVLGSDGLYDCLKNQDVVTTARRVLASAHLDCTGAAQSLVDRAIKMGSTDNITAVVLLLHDRRIQLAKSNSRLFRNKD